VRGFIISLASLVERNWLAGRAMALPSSLGFTGMPICYVVRPDRFAAAPNGEYRGDRQKAYWFFDEETTRAAVAFGGDRKIREKQMLTFGLTFRMEGAFLSGVPRELIGAGDKLGHATGTIQFRVITGPAVQIGPDVFRMQFDRAEMGGTLRLQEEHSGDDRYRRAVQPGRW